MAVAFDSTFEKGVSNVSSPLSFVSNAGTVTGSVGNNANRVLIAYVGFAASGLTSVAVTWAGQAMTAITSQATGAYKAYLFGLINPTTGNQTLSVSWVGGTVAGGAALGAVSLYNADQATGWQNGNTATGTSTAPSIAITTVSGDMAVAGLLNVNSNTPMTVTTGTEAWHDFSLDGNHLMAYNAAAGASTTIAWSLFNSVAWAIVGVDVIAAAATVAGGSARRILRSRMRTW